DAAGTVPGAATRPRYATSTAPLPSAHAAAPANISHPTGFDGRAAATSAPANANAATTAALNAAAGTSDCASAACAHSDSPTPPTETARAATTAAALTLISTAVCIPGSCRDPARTATSRGRRCRDGLPPRLAQR